MFFLCIIRVVKKYLYLSVQCMGQQLLWYQRRRHWLRERGTMKDMPMRYGYVANPNFQFKTKLVLTIKTQVMLELQSTIQHQGAIKNSF